MNTNEQFEIELEKEYERMLFEDLHAETGNANITEAAVDLYYCNDLEDDLDEIFGHGNFTYNSPVADDNRSVILFVAAPEHQNRYHTILACHLSSRECFVLDSAANLEMNKILKVVELAKEPYEFCQTWKHVAIHCPTPRVAHTIAYHLERQNYKLISGIRTIYKTNKKDQPK